jgi:hypothetical protein
MPFQGRAVPTSYVLVTASIVLLFLFTAPRTIPVTRALLRNIGQECLRIVFLCFTIVGCWTEKFPHPLYVGYSVT